MEQFLGWQNFTAAFTHEVARCAIKDIPNIRKVEVSIVDHVLVINCWLTMQGEVEHMRQAYEGKL
jgi:hypothetical protein